jgi:hypothetical protein
MLLEPTSFPPKATSCGDAVTLAGTAAGVAVGAADRRVPPERQAIRAASAAARAPASMAALLPEAVAVTGSWPTAAAIAGSEAAPMAAPTWRLVWLTDPALISQWDVLVAAEGDRISRERIAGRGAGHGRKTRRPAHEAWRVRDVLGRPCLAARDREMLAECEWTTRHVQ